MANVNRIPGAVWDPIKGASTLSNDPDRMTVHIAVSRSGDIYGPGKGPGGTYAGAYSPRSGRMRQHQYIDRRTYADLDGNGETFSVEHEGWPGQSLTENQLDNDARLFAHLVTHYGVPNRIATWDDTRGLAWHRLGCKGNFGAFDKNDPCTWSASQTGQRWSTAFGKTCPTDNFIKQIPEIYARAQKYISGTPGGSPAPTPTDWLDMFKDEADFKRAIREVLTDDWITVGGDTGKRYGDGQAAPYSLWRDGSYSLDELRDLPVRKYPVYGSLKGESGEDDMTLLNMWRRAAGGQADLRRYYPRIMAELGAIQANLAGDVTSAEVARELAPLLLDDLQATITEAIDASEDRTPEEIAAAVVTEITARLED